MREASSQARGCGLYKLQSAEIPVTLRASGKHGKRERERERERERKFGKGRQTHICIILYHHRSMLAPLIALS